MQLPSKPTAVLEYHRPAAAPLAWPCWLLLIGAVPFLVEIIAIFLEAATGDPPSNLREFKAYHYAVASAALIAAAWFVCVAYSFRHRHRWWVLLVCAGWCAWVFWVGFWFLRDLHRHPAGVYYWSIW